MTEILEALLLRQIGRAGEFPSVGAAMAAFETDHQLDQRVTREDPQGTPLIRLLRRLEGRRLISVGQWRTQGLPPVELTAAGREWLENNPG